MPTSPAIKRFIAAVLLVVSLIGFLPKSVFHDALAKHTDTAVCARPDKVPACVHPQGFHCGFTETVVSSPFEPALLSAVPCGVQAKAIHAFVFSSFILPAAFLHCESRGPPQVFA